MALVLVLLNRYEDLGYMGALSSHLASTYIITDYLKQ